MERRIISILLCSFLAIGAFAQQRSEEPEEYGMRKQHQSVQYCLSYADYQKGVWHDADDVKVRIRKADRKAPMARLDYYFTSYSDRYVTKILRDTTFAVRIGDKYYVHAKFLQYGGIWMYFKRDYVRAYPMSDRRLLFVSRYIGPVGGLSPFSSLVVHYPIDAYTPPMDASSNGYTSNTADYYRRGGYTLASEYPHLVCYYADSSSSHVKIVDGESFRQLVAGHTDVIDMYNKVCGTTYFQKADASIVFPLLKKAGVLLSQP